MIQVQATFTCTKCTQIFDGTPSQKFEEFMKHLKYRHPDYYNSTVIKFYAKEWLHQEGFEFDENNDNKVILDVTDRRLQGLLIYPPTYEQSFEQH